MIWRDVVLESFISNETISDALAKIFLVDAKTVKISRDIEDIPEDGIFCQFSECPGGTFRWILSIYLQDEPDQPLDTLQKLARHLNSRLVTSDDDTADPYAVLLVEPGGGISKARLNAEDLDENEIYNLVEPLTGEPDQAGDQPPKLGVHAGNPCPKEGFWHTPAKAGSRRYFQKGELMPELQSAYGASIWQWDTNQERPSLQR